jgi:hypothetical protein
MLIRDTRQKRKTKLLRKTGFLENTQKRHVQLFFKAFERCIVPLRIAGHGEKSNIFLWFLRYGRSTMVIRV